MATETVTSVAAIMGAACGTTETVPGIINAREHLSRNRVRPSELHIQHLHQRRAELSDVLLRAAPTAPATRNAPTGTRRLTLGREAGSVGGGVQDAACLREGLSPPGGR